MNENLRRNALWQLVQTVAGVGAELAVLLAFAAHRNPQEFGALALALSASKLVFLVCEPRIHEFLTPKLARYLGRSHRGTWTWVSLARRIELTLNVFALGLCVLLAAVVPIVSDSVASLLVAVCALYACTNTLLKFSSLAIFRCLGEVRIAALHSIVSSVLKLIVLVLCLRAEASAEWLVLLLAVPTGLVAAWNAHVATRLLAARAGTAGTWKRRRLRASNRVRQLHLIFSNYATGLIDIGHRELDMQLAGWFAGAAEAGRYRLAKTLAMCVLEALNPVVLVLLPELARRLSLPDRPAIGAFLRRISVALALISLAACLLVLGAAAIYLHQFAQAYADTWPSLAVLLAGFVLIAPTLWAQAYLVAVGKPEVYLRASLVGAIVAVGLACTWVGPWGAPGSALAHCTGLAVSNLLAMAAATSHLRRTGNEKREA